MKVISLLSAMISPAIPIDACSDQLPEHIAALPQTPGIYSLQIPGKPPHLSSCPNLQRRVTRLLDPSYTLSGRIRDSLAQIKCWPTGSKLESLLLMHRLAQQHFPDDYLKRIRLRLPVFLVLSRGNGFPRLVLTREVSRREEDRLATWGPFPSRDAAEWYSEETASLFQLRRCPDVLTPDPSHPGCIYGEMNQCLRPCQAHVSADEYQSEVQRVQQFLTDNGKLVTATLSAARSRACEEMDFEQAALIHKRIEKIQAVAVARHKIVTEIDRFCGVALTGGTAPQEFILWPMHEGFWQEPIILRFAFSGERPVPLDTEIRERLSECLKAPQQNAPRGEELAIFSRWYFSSWRDGDWFGFHDLKELNYRKLVRALSARARTGPAEMRLEPKSW